MYLAKVWVVGQLLCNATAFGADATFEFKQIWEQVKQSSPELRAAQAEYEASKIEASRTQKHWYPKLSLEGRLYSTNDPTMNFMSLLGQRQVTVGDFSPTQLNQPGSQLFERGTLAMDFPLFEGGGKQAIAASAEVRAQAKQFEAQAGQLRVYTELAANYATILALDAQARELNRLQSDVNGVLSRYRIGSRSNPMGYSGLLGLKNLRNRIESELLTNTSRMTAARERVRSQAAALPEDWKPAPAEAEAFVRTTLAPQMNREKSLSARASESAAFAAEQLRGAARARFLPKVGVFASGDLYAGDRAAATGYTGGVYLQWDLFSASNIGVTDEAELHASAKMAQAEGERKRQLASFSESKQNMESLEKNLSLMAESAKLLEEQTEATRGLFHNGQINALQLVEVISRRADLVVSRGQTQIAWTEARRNLILNSGAEGLPDEK